MTVLSSLYGRAATLRRSWYAANPRRSKSLNRPVISVGNLVVGGSGKTPVVAAIAQRLLAAGERPAILSRGYGRRDSSAGVVIVSDGHAVLAEVARSGDEPYMLAGQLPGCAVLVSPSRYTAGVVAETQLGCTVHLLDDGFQHVQLKRNVNLLVVSLADLEEPVLPSGRLREPLSSAREADALLIDGSEADAEQAANRLEVPTVFRLERRYAPLRPLVDQRLESRRAIAVAAIARPQRFFAALRGQGWDIAREFAFRDHHWFTSREIDSIEAAARTAAAVVVTTEKDAARLGPRPGWAVLPVEAVLDEAFAPWLAGRLAAAQRSH